ncbi:MAG: hypothetical protein HQ486_07635 [Acidimicrobiaceae bacterium]|nr:hypothetical protein [Acidimicrobiaceae bacterium]
MELNRHSFVQLSKVRSCLSFLVYALFLSARGWGNHLFLNGDDATFFEAAYRDGWKSILKPFLGDSLFIQRIISYAISRGSIIGSSGIMFVVMIAGTAALALAIEISVRKRAGRLFGVFAGMIFVLLPPVNTILIGQISTIHTFILTAALVSSLLRAFPMRISQQNLLAVFGFLLAISHPFAFSLYLPLLLNLATSDWRFVNGEKRFYLGVSVGTIIQSAYQVSNSLEGLDTPSGREFGYALRWMMYSLMPPPIRGKSLSESSFSNDWIAVTLSICLVILIVFVLIKNTKNSDSHVQSKIATKLFLCGILLLTAEFLLSSKRYQHYLVIPSMFFWLGCLFLFAHRGALSGRGQKFSAAFLCVLFLLGAAQTIRLGERDAFYPLDENYMTLRHEFWLESIAEAQKTCLGYDKNHIVVLETMPSKQFTMSIPCWSLGD